MTGSDRFYWVICELETVIEAANTIARDRAIPATDSEVRGGAVLYYLGRISKSGNLDGSEVLAREAFTLMKNEPSHIVVYRNWIEAILAQGKAATADEHSIAYLDFLREGGRGNESAQHSVVFWARLVSGHRADLPRSVAFFVEHFPQVDLENLPPERLILPANELYKKTEPPVVES